MSAELNLSNCLKFSRALISSDWFKLTLIALGLIPCAQAGALHDYGDPNVARLWHQLAQLENASAENAKPKPVVRIMQLGDSHTGGDYFTQAYREPLQKRFGNAGIGWITPGYIKNQRSAQVLMRMSGKWTTRISRNVAENFPLGGFASLPEAAAMLEIAPKFPLYGLQRVSIWSRKLNDEASGGWKLQFPDGEVRDLAAPDSNQWQLSYVMGNATTGNAVLGSAAEGSSLMLRPEGNPAELGAIIVDTLSPGITVDALGIVGASQKVIARWQPEALRDQLKWRNPNLLILAFGTNEAFDEKFDADVYKAELHSTLQQLRAAAPQAAILLIGAPNSAKKTGSGESVGCRYKLPKSLRTVQKIQNQVAIEEKLLYWDWEAAMGGRCSMQKFAEASPALGRPDLVHMTEEGYTRSGEAFYTALMQRYKAKRVHK